MKYNCLFDENKWPVFIIINVFQASWLCYSVVFVRHITHTTTYPWNLKQELNRYTLTFSCVTSWTDIAGDLNLRTIYSLHTGWHFSILFKKMDNVNKILSKRS